MILDVVVRATHCRLSVNTVAAMSLCFAHISCMLPTTCMVYCMLCCAIDTVVNCQILSFNPVQLACRCS